MDYFSLIIKMLKTSHLLNQNLFDDFKNMNLDQPLNKSQLNVLMYIYGDGKNTMSSLCEKTELKRGSMTSVIDSLEVLNLVQRQRDEEDRRRIFITLTQEGQQLAISIKDNMNQYLKERLKHLSEEEMQLFIQGLNQLSMFNKKLEGQG